MHILGSVEIIGFWGSRNFSINFFDDVNFLIGVNGSGKTTAINLIAAALKADFVTLDRLLFDKLIIHLIEVGSEERASIEVEKKTRKNSPRPRITYRIRDKSSAEPTVYNPTEVEGRVFYVEYGVHYREATPEESSGLVEHLKRLVNVSWLSIHRSEISRYRDDRSYESTVDRKLIALSNEFVKYFSFLAKQGATEADKFQKTVFLSLIPKQSRQQLISSIGNLTLEDEKKALIAIFKEFRLEEQRFAKDVEEHFHQLQIVMDRVKTHSAIDADQFAVLVSTWRIHSVVQEWHKLIESQTAIYEPRETFLQIVNNMVQRKTLIINDKNELIAKTQSGKELPLTMLSSGEKQLLIILGEALLQQKAPWIYIADEPELSLHVLWQEQIITNLRKINQNTQIIFATHSPDIVSVYDDRVFDMEKILK